MKKLIDILISMTFLAGISYGFVFSNNTGNNNSVLFSNQNYFPNVLNSQSPMMSTLISPIGDGGFETGNTFALNNWTVVNGAYNKLYVGNTPVVYAGTNCAFSGSSISSWTGTGNASVNHFYRDITFPAGETNVQLTFYYKESVTDIGYDQLKVFLVPTTTTPVAGTQLISGQIGSIYQTATSWTLVTINLNGINGTQRLVFSWKTDDTFPYAAVAIDNIQLTSDVPPPPLSGTYTIDNTLPTSGTNYASFTDAINVINLAGISSTVTFNVTAGQTFTEDPPALTATGTSSNAIIFQKYGSGANPQIRPTGTTGTSDFGFCISGGDYITLDGIDINIATGSAVEYGYYLLGAATNGCQYNTIKNSTITLNKDNVNSRGVYLYSTATSITGANSYNKFYNNTVQNAYNGYYFYGSSSALDNGNEIGTTGGGTSTITDIGGSFLSTYMILIVYQTNVKIFNNSIRSGAANTSNVYGIYSNAGVNTLQIYNNEIKDLATSGIYSYVYGINLSNSGSASVYGNSIHNLNNTNASAFSTYGIYSGVSNNIYKNNIYSIYYSGTYTYTAYGIYIGGGTTTNVYNNFISEIKAEGSTSSTPSAGLYISSGTTVNIYYNSVLLNYTSTSTTNISAALYATTLSTTTIDLRNNIFVNNTIPGSGTSRAVAFYRSSTGFANIAYTNNNLYYAGTPGTKNLIFYDGTNSDQTLAAYKTRIVTMDQAAITENPPFISSVSPYNLHLNTSIATQCESGGIRVITPIAVTTDYDGDKRWGEVGYSGSGTAPDVGADEFNYVPQVLNLGLTAMLSGYCNGTTMDYTKTVTVELHNSTLPYGLVEAQTVTLDLNGFANPVFSVALNGTPYYIVIKSNNGLETWSATPQTFTGSALSYDFTSAAELAYGSNQLLVGTRWCIISGDVNQDGSVDALDRSLCWNDRNLSGIYATDLNGDGTVDALDRSIAWNNRNRSVQKPVLVVSPNREVLQDKNQINSKGSFDLKLDGSNSKKVKNK
jgi:hypothetical protein